jgi:hypothetical protein
MLRASPHLTPMHVMLYTNGFAFFAVVAAILSTGEHTLVPPAELPWARLTLYGTCSWVGVCCFIGLTRSWGATAAVVATNSRKLLTIVLSFLLFPKPFKASFAFSGLAIVGGVFALWMFGHTINSFSMIGLVLLVGLVAKNSILLIDLTNQLRARGEAVDAALLAACPVRMRPVIMTSLTAILGLLPAALATSVGSQAQRPLAIVVVGGMLVAMVLPQIVLPVLYTFFPAPAGPVEEPHS